MARRRGNRTNYKQDRGSGTTPYRKYPDWRARFENINKDGLDSDVNRGKISLPDPGTCWNCGEKIITGSYKVNNRNEDADDDISESTPNHR